MLKRRKLLVVVAITLLLGLGAAGSFISRTVKAMMPEPRFTRVELKDLKVKVAATGTIEAEEQVVVKSKVAGRIVDLRVDEGDIVRAGDLIARVDPIEIKRQLNQVKADIAGAQARVTQALLTRGLNDRTLSSQLDGARAALSSTVADHDKVKAGARAEELARSEAALQQAAVRLEDAARELNRRRDWVTRGLARRQSAADQDAALAELARLRAGARPQEIATSQAAYDRACINRDEARRVAVRKRNLRGMDFASDADVDLAETQQKAAEQDARSAGEQLALIKAGTRPEEVRAAEARLERARFVLDQTKETETQSVESAQAAHAVALRGHEIARQELMLLRAGARPEELRSSEAQVQRAGAALKEAQARMEQSKINSEEIVAARAQVARLIETLANIQTQLDDTIVSAPMGGVVIHRALRKGELVTSGITSFTAGMEIVTIADLSSLLVRVRVNEVDVARLYLRQRTEVTVDALAEESFEGRIKKIAPASVKGQLSASQLQQNAGNSASEIVWFDVEVQLPNADRRLKPGMSANLEVITARAGQVPALAREAVITKDRKSHALKVTNQLVIAELKQRQEQRGGDDEFDEKKLKKKLPLTEELAKTQRAELKLGLRDEQFAQIKSGLAVGDWVLIKASGDDRRTFEIGKGRRD